jgi:hypothetical protein
MSLASRETAVGFHAQTSSDATRAEVRSRPVDRPNARRAAAAFGWLPSVCCTEKLNTGDLPQIIANEERLYDGDLSVYFRVLFFKARNLNNPYHNFRHMLHVVWLCHQACRYYRDELSPRQMRILLIAALFHDFDHAGHPHPGKEDPDGINIEIAIAGLRRHITRDDRPLLPEIEALIEATQFPHQSAGEDLDLLGKIIRDADLAQSISPVWIQQVVFGLARECRVEPLAVLKAQKSFLSTLPFNTQWARQLFPQQMIEAKIEEVEKLLWLLEPEQATAAQRHLSRKSGYGRQTGRFTPSQPSPFKGEGRADG